MDILTRVNWVDILSVIIIVRIGYVALQDGLSHEIFPLIGAAITAALGIRYYPEFSLFIQRIANLPAQGLDFLVLTSLVVVVGFIFKMLRVLVDALIKVTWHPFVDKFGGLISGLLRASIVLSLLLNILILAPFSYFSYSIKDKSLSGPYFIRIAPGISSKLAWALPVLVK